MNRFLGAALAAGLLMAACSAQPSGALKAAEAGHTFKVVHTDAEWRKLLTPAQYAIMRQKGTEAPCSGAFWNNHAAGTYVCAGCGTPLFVSDTKFDSGTGWPSFFTPVTKDAIYQQTDDSLGMHRIEVECGTCGSHLGHVFEDGPPPTHLRFCINSLCLKFVPKK